jgi:hypothetical protein
MEAGTRGSDKHKTETCPLLLNDNQKVRWSVQMGGLLCSRLARGSHLFPKTKQLVDLVNDIDLSSRAERRGMPA